MFVTVCSHPIPAGRFVGIFNGKDGTFSLADARREPDKAKDLLKDGKDPSTEKQFDKHRQAAARPFEQWANE